MFTEICWLGLCPLTSMMWYLSLDFRSCSLWNLRHRKYKMRSTNILVTSYHRWSMRWTTAKEQSWTRQPFQLIRINVLWQHLMHLSWSNIISHWYILVSSLFMNQFCFRLIDCVFAWLNRFQIDRFLDSVTDCVVGWGHRGITLWLRPGLICYVYHLITYFRHYDVSR